MEASLEKRVQELEKKVSDLESQIAELKKGQSWIEIQ